MSLNVLCIGECMLELQILDGKSQGLGFGGDSFNTALSLKSALGETAAEP